MITRLHEELAVFKHRSSISMKLFHTTVAWVVVSGIVLVASGLAEDVSFVSDPIEMDDTQTEWKKIPFSDLKDSPFLEDDSAIIPITTEKLPEFTVTYDVVLWNWPAVVISVSLVAIFLFVMLVILLFRRYKHRRIV